MSPGPLTAHDLAVTVRRLRGERRLTIDQVAHAAGMHPTYLSSIERGLHNPTWEKVAGLAAALGLTMSALAAQAEEVQRRRLGHELAPEQ